jgi:predicted peroxiredoxin
MKVLFLALAGTSDPTRASIPLHLAANGSLEIGQDVSVVLGGDATEMVRANVRESLQGVGLPAAHELFGKLRDHAVPVYV